MKQLIITMFCLVGMLSASTVLSQDEMTIQQIKQKESRGKTNAMIDGVIEVVDRESKERKIDCDEAVGYEPFCSCISKNIPYVFSFFDYVAITTKSKEENKYNELDESMRKAYDKVYIVRDNCVRAINKKH